MRRILDLLYDGTAVLAALLMLGTLLMVLGTMIDRVVTLPLRGMDAYAGYCMAGAGFLALAHTLKRGEHIRVSLLLTRLGAKGAHRLELVALTVAVLLGAALAYYSLRLVLQSLEFNDVSPGNDATPLWIPQLSMAAGAFLLLVAFLDELWLEWRGLRRVPQSDELLLSE